jgi:uncharacterized Zn finger protein
MRERAPEKAGRLLATRRVHIVRVDGADVDAVVQGDTGTYVVERRLGRFACSCPSPGPCSHGRAVDAGRRSSPGGGVVAVHAGARAQGGDRVRCRRV